MKYLGSLFGILSLLLVIYIIFYVITLQFEQFGAGETGHPLKDQETGRLGDTQHILETVEMADDVSRVLETKNRIPADLLE